MSRQGLKVARSADSRLPTFSGQREARSVLLALRDERLLRLRTWAANAAEPRFDGTPESLKRIEAWYFSLVDQNRFRSIGTTREEFEDCMTTYFCHVAVASHADAKWVVEESPSVPGHFAIGVRRGYCTWASSFRDHFRVPLNKNRTRIFRDFKKYFGHA